MGGVAKEETSSPLQLENQSFSSNDVESTFVAGEVPRPSRVDLLLESIDLCAGDQVGRYLLLSPVGAGGMGVVFSAFDPDLNRKIALKFIRAGFETSSDDSTSTFQVDTRSRLLQEAKYMAQLGDPNVVAIYDVGEMGTHVFLAMELIEGESLKAWIHRGGYRWPQALKIMVQAGRGLASAHDAGLVHRDFKPDNVLLGRDGKVCVADFGLVFQQSTTGTISDQSDSVQISTAGTETTRHLVMGTPSYMSPEQHRGELVTERSDQFSFCVTLYEACYGLRPFLGRNLGEIKSAIEQGQFTSPSEGNRVPRWLDRVIRRGLSLDPAERFPSMRALLAELERVRHRNWQLTLVVGSLCSLALTSVVQHELLWGQDARSCDTGESKMKGLWNDQVQSQIREQFLATGLGYAASVWSKIQAELGQRSQDWADAYEFVCETSSNQQMQVAQDRRAMCLEQELGQFETLLNLLGDADETTVERSLTSVQRMRPIEECLDEETLAEQEKLPSDPSVRHLVLQLSQELNGISLMRNMGKGALVKQKVQELLPKIHATEYPPLLALAYRDMALIAADEWNKPQAALWIEKALLYAEAGQNEIITADVSSFGVFVVGVVLRKTDEVDDWVAHAQAHLMRAGDHPLARARWLSNSGSAYGINGRFEESEAALRESVDIYERELGNMNDSMLTSINNLAYTQYMLGDLEEAGFLYRKVIRLFEATKGRLHPQNALSLTNYVLLLARLGRYEETLRYSEQLMAVLEASQVHGDFRPTSQHIICAEVLFAAGHYALSAAQWQRMLEVDEGIRNQIEVHRIAHAYFTRTSIRQGKIEQAELHGKSIDLEKRGPKDGERWELPFIALIELEMAKGRAPEALKVWQQLVSHDPNILHEGKDQTGRFNLLLGDLRWALDQPDEAVELHDRALKLAAIYYPEESNANLVVFREALARSQSRLGDGGMDNPSN